MTVHFIANQSNASLVEHLIDFLTPYFRGTADFKLVLGLPEDQSIYSWEEIFNTASSVREFMGPAYAESYFVCMVPGENEENWFAAQHETDAKLGFVQTTGWEFLEEIVPMDAIAYHAVTLLVRMMFYGNLRDSFDSYHQEAIGCMNDFSGIKSQVIYKLKSATICPVCIHRMLGASDNLQAKLNFLRGTKQVFEEIRRRSFEIDIPALIRKEEYQLRVDRHFNIFIEMNATKIPLKLANGWEKAIYLLLLHHPNGISYQEFQTDEILKKLVNIYLQSYTCAADFQTLYKELQIAKENNSLVQDKLMVQMSRIRRNLKKQLASNHPKLLRELLISDKRGPKIIPINRDLIHWDVSA